MAPTKGTILLSGVAATFAIPPVIFLVAAFRGGLDSGQAFEAMAAQYVAERQNLLVSSATGLIPLVLLAIVLWVVGRFAGQKELLPALALGGLIPIVAVSAWVHQDFWPLFLPDRVYPGFPHGLGFVIGPLFFAPVGMAVGMLVAWLVQKVNR